MSWHDTFWSHASTQMLATTITQLCNKAVHRSRVRPQFRIEYQTSRPGDLGR